MFTLMGNCISSIKKKRQPKRSVTLAILGLDSAGKTTTTNAFLGDELDTAPTIGFNKEEFTFLNYNINLYDLGGGRKIRDIWKGYLHEIYGVIYVVDSAAPERFPEVKESLTSLLQNDKVKGKPLLILANKDDLPDHLEEVDIMEQLGVEDLVNVNKCYCHMQMCSAIKGTGRKIDPQIKNGMTWFCGILDKLYDKMKARVDADVEEIEEIRRKEKEARKERVRKQREEREKQQEEERIRLGEDKVEEEDDGDFVDGDPFRKLDADEIKRKEAKYKEAKAKEKERQRKLKELNEPSKNGNNNVRDIQVTSKNVNATPGGNDEEDDDDGIRAPRSSRSLFGMNWMNGASNGNSRQLLPPLESQSDAKGLGISPRSDKKRTKKLKNKIESRDIDYRDHDSSQYGHGMSSMSRIEVEPINGKDDDDDDTDSIIHSSSRLPFRKSRGLYIDDSARSESPDSGRQKKSKKKQHVLSSDGEDGFDTLRLSQYMDEEKINGYSKTSYSKDSSKYPVSSPAFTNGHTEDRSETPVKKTKKKKKHLRKNKLSPSDDEFELSDVQTTPQKTKQWARTPSPGKMLENEDMKTNWGLAEDLPSGDEVQQFRRTGPNFDAEDELQL